jgi:hypothetical protein
MSSTTAICVVGVNVADESPRHTRLKVADIDVTRHRMAGSTQYRVPEVHLISAVTSMFGCPIGYRTCTGSGIDLSPDRADRDELRATRGLRFAGRRVGARRRGGSASILAGC